ncbi:UNVERIFIED_CONTAM: hypothetical protein Slati_3010300 [Sesamum latifolium]|uniref:Uncharacterized protein n=1 Tax=Sesamum latifolium TaxID=2727402 RepID=A0AAW2VJC7_9LAMI
MRDGQPTQRRDRQNPEAAREVRLSGRRQRLLLVPEPPLPVSPPAAPNPGQPQRWDPPQAPPRGGGCTGGGIQYANIGGFAPNPGANNYPVMNASPGCLVGSSSSSGFGGNGGNNSDDLFPFSGQTTGLSVQEYEQTPIFCSPDASSLHYQPADVITVFINGVATEVGRGPMDIRAMCGGDFVLFMHRECRWR